MAPRICMPSRNRPHPTHLVCALVLCKLPCSPPSSGSSFTTRCRSGVFYALPPRTPPISVQQGATPAALTHLARGALRASLTATPTQTVRSNSGSRRLRVASPVDRRDDNLSELTVCRCLFVFPPLHSASLFLRRYAGWCSLIVYRGTLTHLNCTPLAVNAMLTWHPHSLF